ncbi:MAG: nucleotidyltransferase domain-containing protein, partial [Verrucomicrobiota bacterium]
QANAMKCEKLQGMKERILEVLGELEREHGFRVVYACESGSRAWGFESTDSDYDVRFLFVWPRERYLSIRPVVENYDFGVDADLLDLTGWELRRALQLLHKSNAGMLERVHSPIIYRGDAELIRQLRDLTPEFFIPRATAAHYLGLAKKMWRGSIEAGEVTAKKYLYALRSILSAEWIVAHQTRPPVPFAEVRAGLELDAEFANEIDRIIEEKSGQHEKDAIERSSILDNAIENALTHLPPTAAELSDAQGDSAILDEFLQRALT